MNQLREHRSVKAGKLAVFECKEVPKKFNALFSATWRRYLYLFPLCSSAQTQDKTLKPVNVNKFKDDDEFVQKKNNRFVDPVPTPPTRYFPHLECSWR